MGDVATDAAGEMTSIPRISDRRRKKAAELAHGRIAQMKQDSSRGLFYGVFFLVFGTLFLITSLSRLVVISNDGLNLVGFGIGLILASLGGYLTLWFFKLSRSLKREEKTLKEEIRRSS